MNSRFQLYLDTQNADLFAKATSELGTVFYRQLDEKTFEICYFSGSRIARFVGVPTEQIMRLCELCGFQVNTIEIDEQAGTVRILERGPTT